MSDEQDASINLTPEEQARVLMWDLKGPYWYKDAPDHSRVAAQVRSLFEEVSEPPRRLPLGRGGLLREVGGTWVDDLVHC